MFVAILNVQTLPLSRIRNYNIIQEKICRVGKNKCNIRVVDTLNPEERALLFVRHDDEVAKIGQADQTGREMEEICRIVFYFTKSCINFFHFSFFSR